MIDCQRDELWNYWYFIVWFLENKDFYIFAIESLDQNVFFLCFFVVDKSSIFVISLVSFIEAKPPYIFLFPSFLGKMEKQELVSKWRWIMLEMLTII